MEASEILEQLKLVKNPKQLAEIHEELEVLYSLQQQQLKHMKKVFDDHELSKQQFLSKKNRNDLSQNEAQLFWLRA